MTILRAGRHDFNSSTLIVSEKAIPLQDIVMKLDQIRVTTKDRMPMNVTGQVTYRITDPEKLITGIGQDKLQAAIVQTADASLRHFVSATDLSIIAPDQHQSDKKQVIYNQQKDGKIQLSDQEEKHITVKEPDNLKVFGDISSAEGNDYRGKLCNGVQQKLTQTAAKWGVQIVEFAISDIRFADEAVEKALMDATTNTRKAEAALDLQKANNAKILAEQKTQADLERLKAETEANKLKTKTASEAEASVIKSKAEADANLYFAQNKAKADLAGQQIMSEFLVTQAINERKAAEEKAAGEAALNRPMLERMQNDNWVKLALADKQIKIAEHNSRRKVPAVTFGDKPVDNTFFNQGMDVVNFAISQSKKQLSPPTSPKTSQQGIFNKLPAPEQSKPQSQTQTQAYSKQM